MNFRRNGTKVRSRYLLTISMQQGTRSMRRLNQAGARSQKRPSYKIAPITVFCWSLELGGQLRTAAARYGFGLGQRRQLAISVVIYRETH